MKKSGTLLTIIFAIILTSFYTESNAQDQTYSYAYISIRGKVFSKKLNIFVDLGDSPEQKAMANEYSEKLSDKKSYAAILNFMVENQFELVETLVNTSIDEGTGGTSGIIFIMKKME